MDGHFIHSKVKTLLFNSQSVTTILNILPNPFEGNFRVNYSMPYDGTVVFNIIDALGKQVMTKVIDSYKGFNTLEFNTDNLEAGVYFININFNGTSSSYKMVKK